MPGGRPSKFTPQAVERLLDAIRAGNYREPACRFAGIDVNTFYRWCDRGKKQRRGKFREFWEKVQAAESECEVGVVANWKAKIPDNWQAAVSFLKCRYPERWQERVHLQVDSELEAMLDLLKKELPADQYENVIRVVSSPDFRVGGAPPPGDRAE